MNNSSMFTADRMTHLKIVVVSLVCATLVAVVGVASHLPTPTMMVNGHPEAAVPVIKAPKPLTAQTEQPSAVR